jgi:hypothetical protein
MSKKNKQFQTSSNKSSKTKADQTAKVGAIDKSSGQPSMKSSTTSSAKSKETSQDTSSWNSYGLDQIAQRLVLEARERDPDSLNQGHKMRMAVSYGLERFWGEHLRLEEKEPKKSKYWKETWDALVQVMKVAGLTIPNDAVSIGNVQQIQAMSSRLWDLELEDQRIAMAVLTQLCDCIVWWTQRYKVRRSNNDDAA